MQRMFQGSILATAMLFLPLLPIPLRAQAPVLDSDHDGLSDDLEQRLLDQFTPQFMIGSPDCSNRPALFQSGIKTPRVLVEDGTIYGQAFPSKSAAGTVTVELHYYHLWKSDCGPHGHALDTEHVAVLVHASTRNLDAATWQAQYWYAAAHEDTVCDVSQITRASTLGAETHGATVWISPGKHASYLNATLCRHGCGADRCEISTALQTSRIINLGEPGQPMNQSLFIASSQWPLLAKMSASNFPAAQLARLNTLPPADIAWFNPGHHPAQAVIAHSLGTEQALATSSDNTVVAISLAGGATGDALSTAGNHTGEALSGAGSSTGSALGTSYRHTRSVLRSSACSVGKALHLGSQRAESDQRR